MELVYLSDPMTRYAAWSAYPTWEDINSRDRIPRKHQPVPCRETKINEKNCSICQRKKKRSLSDYIKSKQIDCQNSTSIQEEDEEEEEPEAGSSPPEGKKQPAS